ncbi:MAG: glycosyl transferase family protein [uncultured bacterium]|nr:MAG: glycosyl transferase family protein [uncultured bacterium]
MQKINKINNEPYLSVVIPAYNEEINIKRGVLDSVNEYLVGQNFTWEVLILDDGSKDKTIELAQGFSKKHKGFSVFSEPHRGKGGTVIAGMQKAKGKYVLFTDMDQSTPMDQFDKFLPKTEEGFDVVIGSRSGRPGQSIIRKTMAYGFVFLRTIILRLPYKDTQCGFKLFSRKSAKEIFSRMEVFGKQNKGNAGGSVTAGFDLETLYIARKLELKVAEVSVEWYEYGERKEVNPIKDSWEGFRDLMKVRLNAIQGKYKI